MTFLLSFHETATTYTYTLSLHDALPICHQALHAERRVGQRVVHHDVDAEGTGGRRTGVVGVDVVGRDRHLRGEGERPDRKSTRLNSSHSQISYAVFCLKKKNEHNRSTHR